MSVRKLFAMLGMLIVVSTIVTACATTPPTPQVIEKPVVVTQVVTQVVEKEKMVTPTPAPISEAKSKDPTTLIATWGTGSDPETFDPALNYESAGGEILQQVYEGLIFFKKENPVEFIPQLATAWKISDDGKTYTFTIRQGVKFHDGAPLTAEDIAYSFQRGLLQGGTYSPQWLLAQPLFGADVIDVAGLIDANLMDDPNGLKTADPASLKAACEKVKTAITADNATGTVTFKLAQSWGPFLPTLAGTWGSAMSKAWVVANGGWDGSCDTWQNFYGVTADADPFTSITNGTGPYKLDRWTKGEEIVLVRNDDYWRTEPGWDGGPVGPASIARIVIKLTGEWGTRLSMLQAGDADFAYVPAPNYSQADQLVGEECVYNPAAASRYDCKTVGAGPLRVFKGIRGTARNDVFFNFKINIPEGGNPYAGSGKLDGKGVPPDFFSDVHVRKAFNYCFDFDTFIQETLRGEATQATTLFMEGMPGYDPQAPHYSYDLAKCEEEFKAAALKSADGRSLWDTGFRLQMVYTVGVTEDQSVAEILAENLAKVNEKFLVETVGLPWAALLDAQRAGTMPLFASGWIEDIHDPHNWVVPYTTASGTYSGLQSLPKESTDAFEALANAGVTENDPAKRAAIYAQVNQKFYDLAPDILLAVVSGRHYEQRWVQGWYDNPKYSGRYYYSLSKK